MYRIMILLAVMLVACTAVSSSAAQMRVFVADIDAVGVPNRDELKVTLKNLLASRLNGPTIISVGNVAEADVVVNGTYVAIGKIFSIDVIAKTVGGKTLNRAFVQGNSQDDIIPSVGKLAEKLSAELIKTSSASLSESQLLAQPATSPPAGMASSAQIVPAPEGEFIKPLTPASTTSTGWLSKRLVGAANLMAIGRELPDGVREIFLAEASRITYYHQGSSMTLMAEAEFGPVDKIISLDTITNNDGLLDIYVTIIRAGELASQVWQVKDDKLIQVVKDLPYYFRSASLNGGSKKLYAQAMGREEDFYGNVAEAFRTGAEVTLKNQIKMPRYGMIYGFNQLRDRDGKILTVVINPDGYLIVFDKHQKELWRSNDKFGGSELFFKKEDIENIRVTGDPNRWIFMNQRIQVTDAGQLIVGKNDGFWVMGNARSYKRGAVYCMFWNGSSLEEKWRTRETQDYMPDFFLDETRNELLILQTVQRPGITNRGASSLSIKKVE